MIIQCKCGESYQADERHLGYSIKCKNCSNVIPIVRPQTESSSYYAGTNSAYSKSSTIFENASVKQEKPILKNIVLPVVGLLFLLIGIILTVASLRQPNNAQPNNSALAQVSPQTSAPPSNSSKAIPSNENQKKAVPSKSANVNSNTQTNQSSELSSTPTPSPETVRYDTGKNLISPQAAGGRGTLEISNGTPTDAIAKLVDARTNKTLRLVYIQSNSIFTLKNIKIGTYVLKFSLGNGYIPSNGKFLFSQSYTQFDEAFNFEENREGNSIVWSNYRVTLNKVVDGNARSSSISESDFEDK